MRFWHQTCQTEGLILVYADCGTGIPPLTLAMSVTSGNILLHITATTGKAMSESITMLLGFRKIMRT
jgi:hypothetical protein